MTLHKANEKRPSGITPGGRFVLAGLWRERLKESTTIVNKTQLCQHSFCYTLNNSNGPLTDHKPRRSK